MPSNQTANCALNQWSKDDQVLMEDFNADNAKIDGALKAHSDALAAEAGAREALAESVPKIAVGTYTGDGTENRFFSVGFTPKAVIVMPRNSGLYFHSGDSYTICGGLAVPDGPAKLSSIEAVSIQPGGFRVTAKTVSPYYARTNYSGTYYRYLAIG